ncbi:hypothetical protein D3C77_617020 [compost metagenome]
MKRAGKTSQIQTVLDVVAAAPVLCAGLIVGDELRVACGEIDGVDVGLELGPTAEPQVTGN